MLTSASATPQAALAKLLAGLRPECSSPATSSRARAFVLVAKLAVHPPRDPQQQIPPASTRPTICSSCDDDEREGDAQHQRGEHADQDDFLALIRRETGGQRSDDDRIVAGEHDVDQQDLEEGRDRAGADEAGIHRDSLAEARRTCLKPSTCSPPIQPS